MAAVTRPKTAWIAGPSAVRPQEGSGSFARTTAEVSAARQHGAPLPWSGVDDRSPSESRSGPCATAPSWPGSCSRHTCSSSWRRAVKTVGFDAFAYWNVNPADPYQVGVGGLGAFNYTPPIARLFGPFGALEWPTFLWLWLALLVGNIIWLGRRGYRIIWLLALPPVALELYHANIHLWIAAAIALGFRYPWTWGFVLLTKVTPGVGLLWFAVRREWRALAIALGVTGVIVAVSLVLEGQLWVDWLAFIGSTPEGGSVAQFQIPIPLWIRLPAAAALVVVGRPDRPALDRRRGGDAGAPMLWVSGFAICAALAHSAMHPADESAG